MNNSRFFSLLCLLLFFFTVVLARFFYWQVVKSGELSPAAQKQHSVTSQYTAERGRVFANDGFPLVLNKKVFDLCAFLPEFRNSPDEVAKDLAHYLFEEDNLEEEIKSLKEKLSSGRKWLILKKQVSIDVKEKLEELSIPGISFTDDFIRDYPEASEAAHLLGFVANDEKSDKKGYFGIEGFYEKELSGAAGIMLGEKGVFGQPIFSIKRLKKEAEKGIDIFLYLDRAAQMIVEEELKKGLAKYGAKSGWAVVISPVTGGILALATEPSFDPGSFFSSEQKIYTNPVISEGFEPGSIFKPLVMAAAIEKGVIKPETKCEICAGPRQIGEYTIKTWNEKYFPESTMKEVLVHSDNVGMVFVSERLGKKNILESLRLFGFGKLTGIDLQGEVTPEVRKDEYWYPIDLATVAFGQGLAITPIQMIRAFAALANGGKLITPKAAAKFCEEGEDEKCRQNLSEKSEKVLSEETTNKIKEMLIAAVDEGEAKWAKPANLTVAGKTGTAQIPIGGYYDKEKTIASFIGFAPAEEAKVVMLVSLREPQSSPWGSETAAPLWFNIAKRLAYLWGI